MKKERTIPPPALRRAVAEVNGLRLFYRDTGSDGPAILCLHGRWGRGETWTDLMARLGARYRIIAPDQRGHGLSDKPEGGYSAEEMAADACGLIEALGCGPVVAVGHSMGGRIVGYLAALYPQVVRAAAILDETPEGRTALGGQPHPDPELDDGLTGDWPTPYLTYEEALRDLRARFPRETNVRYFLESLTETPQGYDFLFSRRAMAAIPRAYRPWHDRLRLIRCPVLLVRAAESWCLSQADAAAMRADIADCAYLEIPGSDHMVYADNPEAFFAGFEAFLRRIGR